MMIIIASWTMCLNNQLRRMSHEREFHIQITTARHDKHEIRLNYFVKKFLSVMSGHPNGKIKEQASKSELITMGSRDVNTQRSHYLIRL